MIERTIINLLSRNKLSVFLFHKVPTSLDPLIPNDVDLHQFRRTIEFISEYFDVLPLSEAIKRLSQDRSNARLACITFDDGYPDWMTGAVPVLEEFELPATFFITSSQFHGTPMWHERISHAVRLARSTTLDMPGFGLPPLPVGNVAEKRETIRLLERYAKYQELSVREHLLTQLELAAGVDPSIIPRFSSDHLRSLHNRGFEIGAHTVDHPILSYCSPKQAMTEIAAVKETLSALIGAPVRSFAYPNGRPNVDFGHEHIEMVRKAGYDYAVTTQWGAATRKTSLFQVPRFTPWGPNATHMAIQVGRNLLTKQKLISLPAEKADNKSSCVSQPIRILVVENGAGFGGAIVALQTLLSHYDPQQVQCHVATNFPLGRFKEIPSVHSHHVVRDRIKDFKPLAQRILKADIPLLGTLLLFLLGRADDLVNRAPYLLKLLHLAIKIKPDIIHGNNEPNSNREAMLVAKLLRKPYVQHVRGPLGASRHMPWLLAAPDAFIPVSRWIAGELLLAGVKMEKIRQIYDAVDLSPLRSQTSACSLRQELAIPKEAIVVAMIGMLVPWKGQQLFIDAVTKLHSQFGTEVKYFLIGGTPERGDASFAEALKKQVADAGLTDVIRFTGQRNDLASILPEITIVVSASIEPEPLGLVMLEAMASGCIFVGPAHGAATEVVKDGETGFLFEPASALSLAGALQRAIHLSQQKTGFSEKDITRALAPFSGGSCAEKTHNLMRLRYR